MASPGLLMAGSSDLDFSNSLPISLISPGFSSGAGGWGCGSICCGAGCAGSGCRAGDCTPSDGCDAPCGQPAPAPSASNDSARPTAASRFPNGLKG